MPQFPEQNVNNALILLAGLDDTPAAGAHMSHATQQSPNTVATTTVAVEIGKTLLNESIITREDIQQFLSDVEGNSNFLRLLPYCPTDH